MAEQNLKARSANQIVVSFDGKQIGAVKSVSLNEDYSPEPVTGIGDIKVQENVPTLARYTVSVNGLVLKQSSMRAAGLFPENSDDMLAGVVFDIMVMSKEDGSLLRKYSGCSYANGSTDISANAIVVNSGTFNALDVSGVGV
jgi:hypothetical protein